MDHAGRDGLRPARPDLYLHGSLDILGGPTPFYSLLTPALIGFPLTAFGLATGHDVLQGLQAFVDVARGGARLLCGDGRSSPAGRRWSPQRLTVAAPGLAYSGLMMTEAVFYPAPRQPPPGPAAEAIARPDAANPDASRRRRSRGVGDADPGDRPAAGAGDGRARRRRDWLARGSNLRRLLARRGGLGVLVARLDRLAAGLRRRHARRLRGGRQHLVQRRRGGPLRPLPPCLPADPLRPVSRRRGRAAARQRGCAGASPTRRSAPTSRRVVAHGLARRRGRRLRLALLRPDRRAEPDRARAGALPRLGALARARADGYLRRAGGSRSGGRSAAARRSRSSAT